MQLNDTPKAKEKQRDNIQNDLTIRQLFTCCVTVKCNSQIYGLLKTRRHQIKSFFKDVRFATFLYHTSLMTHEVCVCVGTV